MSSAPEPRAAAAVPVDQTAFRAAVGRFATGITVVTTKAYGVDHAMTVNSLTSVSLDPVLVLFCAERIARFHDAVAETGYWAASVLGADAEWVSRRLAHRGRPLAEQLDGIAHTPGPHTGAAVLDCAIGVLECRTRAVYDGGDHSIVLGDVLAASAAPGKPQPLLHYEGSYRSLPG